MSCIFLRNVSFLFDFVTMPRRCLALFSFGFYTLLLDHLTTFVCFFSNLNQCLLFSSFIQKPHCKYSVCLGLCFAANAAAAAITTADYDIKDDSYHYLHGTFKLTIYLCSEAKTTITNIELGICFLGVVRINVKKVENMDKIICVDIGIECVYV